MLVLQAILDAVSRGWEIRFTNGLLDSLTVLARRRLPTDYSVEWSIGAEYKTNDTLVAREIAAMTDERRIPHAPIKMTTDLWKGRRSLL